MPRGVYDRTKTKEQRDAEKTKAGKKAAKTAAPKRKYTKRTTTAAPVEPETPKGSGQAHDGGGWAAKDVFSGSADESFFLLTEVRCNLATLMQVAAKHDTPSVQAEIEAHVGILGQLREKLLDVGGSSETSEVEASEETPNGVTAPAVRQASVPLPPPPPVAPVLPTH